MNLKFKFNFCCLFNFFLNLGLGPSTGRQQYENFWISATDLAQEGTFTWFSTGKVVSYFAWDYGQPPVQFVQPDPNVQPDPYDQYIQPEIYDNSEDCVQIHGGSFQWGCANCTILNYFICERV